MKCKWPFPGVAMVATHRLTNVTATTTTDEEGRFRFPYLRIGVYEIKRIADRDSRTSRATSTVSAGSAFEIPFVLPLATIEETITDRPRGAGD